MENTHSSHVTEMDWRVKAIRSRRHRKPVLEHIVENYLNDKVGSSFMEIKEKRCLHSEQVRRVLKFFVKNDIISKKGGHYVPTSLGMKCYSVISGDPETHNIAEKALAEPFQGMVERCLRNLYGEFRSAYLEYDKTPIPRSKGPRFYSSPIDPHHWPILVIFLVEQGIMPKDSELIEKYVKYWIQEFHKRGPTERPWLPLVPEMEGAFIRVLHDEEELDWFNLNFRVAVSLILLKDYCIDQDVRVDFDWDSVTKDVQRFKSMVTKYNLKSFLEGDKLLPYQAKDLPYVLNCLTEPWLKTVVLAKLLNDLRIRSQSCSECGLYDPSIWCDLPIIRDVSKRIIRELEEAWAFNELPVPVETFKRRIRELWEKMGYRPTLEEVSHVEGFEDFPERLPIKIYVDKVLPERCFRAGINPGPRPIASILAGLLDVWERFEPNFSQEWHRLISSMVRYLILSPRHYVALHRGRKPDDYFPRHKCLYGVPETILALDLAERAPQNIADLMNQISKVKEYYFNKLKEGYVETFKPKDRPEDDYYCWLNDGSSMSYIDTSVLAIKALMKNKKIVTPVISLKV